MANLKQKFTDFKQFVSDAFHTYPHAFLLGGLVVLAIIVSMINDSYFGDLFKRSPVPVTPPQVEKPVFLSVLNVDPAAGIKQSFDNFMQIRVTFSAPLDPTSVTVTTSPEHPVGFDTNGTVLRVFPRLPWAFDLGYEIKINAKSTTGLQLEEPYLYSHYIATPADTSIFETY